MASFYKLNQSYIDSFYKNVYSRLEEDDKKTETGLLRTVLKEVTELFRKIGGQISSKRDIPRSDEFPDSAKYNKLIKNIAFDIDKIYNAQKLVEGDVGSLLSFNSNQRDKILEKLSNSQQSVYSAYIKARKESVGGVVIPAGNPFSGAESIGPGSEDVFVDKDRHSLTLGFSSTISKPVDIRGTAVYFSGRKPTKPIYPNNSILGIGSHWKKFSTDPHFIDTTDPSTVDRYKAMLIDDPNNNDAIGVCEFEAVETTNYQPDVKYDSNNNSIRTLKKFIGEEYNKDPELLWVDVANSLQGSNGYFKEELLESKGSQKPQYKLVVPFINANITNEIILEFTPNEKRMVPHIEWSESKVFSNVGGSDVAYSLIEAETVDGDSSVLGKYVCHTASFVIPSRLEIILYYEADEHMWCHIPFFMSHYVYSDHKTYQLPYLSSTQDKVFISLKKSYDIFVDSEANESKEKRRAINALRTPNRGNNAPTT